MLVILSVIGTVIVYLLLTVFVFLPAAGGAVLAVVLIGTYLRAAQQVLAPRLAQADDPLIRVPPAGDGEPAYRSYYAGQVLTDMRSAVRQSWLNAARIIGSPAVRGTCTWLLTARRQPGLPFRDIRGWRVLAGFVIGLAATLAATAAVLFALVANTAIQIVHAALLALITAMLVAAGIVLYGAEAAGLAVRKIRMKCPHPDCYRHIALPFYKCPEGHEHRRLRPGVYGVFWRVCRCDHRLPTALMLKRHQVEAYCPRCERLVPRGLGSVRLVHFPLIGGTSAGKSSLLTAMVAGLESMPQDGGPTVEFASDASRQEYESAKQLLVSGQWPNKTSVDVPEAFMFYTGRGRRRRLVYLYDPRGEVFREADGPPAAIPGKRQRDHLCRRPIFRGSGPQPAHSRRTGRSGRPPVSRGPAGHLRADRGGTRGAPGPTAGANTGGRSSHRGWTWFLADARHVPPGATRRHRECRDVAQRHRAAQPHRQPDPRLRCRAVLGSERLHQHRSPGQRQARGQH